MSFNDTETDSDATDSTDDDHDLEARIRDLEVEVYGYESNDPSPAAEALRDVKRTVVFLDNRLDGAPVEDVYRVAEVIGINRELAEQAYAKLRRQGEVYEITSGEVKPT